MINAKRVLRAENLRQARYRGDDRGGERVRRARQRRRRVLAADGEGKIGSFFIGNAKSFLVTSKQLMRRIRDKVPYSSGDQMMLESAAAAGWSRALPQRLLRDYNQMIDSYNRESNSRGFGR